MKNQKGVSLITLIITIIVVIILAVIVLRSGASDAPDQAAFSKFTSQIGELQDAVKVAMLEAKSSEILKGNQRTEAQLYNFVARGGYKGFEWERSNSPKKDELTDENQWILKSEIDDVKCTPINKKYAKYSIGMELPVIKVETAKGVGQEMTFFVTGKGTVFCWPPYVYDGKSYVNANTTVKSGDKATYGTLIKGDTREELGGTDATKNGEFAIVFSDDEYVGIRNGEGEYLYDIPYRLDTTANGGTISLAFGEYDVLYYDSYKYNRIMQANISGHITEQYHDKPGMTRGEAKGCDFYLYNNESPDYSEEEEM